MKSHKKLIIAISILVAFAAIGTAIATYTPWTPITDVTITSHNDYDIVIAGVDYTLTCTTSTDTDCNTTTQQQVDDPVTHTWSGPGTFDPPTGTSTTWTAPTATGDVTITVTASDSPLADETDKTDSVILTVTDFIYVDEDATGENDGSSWTNAFLKLQDGLETAEVAGRRNHLKIWVAEGTYYPDEGSSVADNNQAESFVLLDYLKVYGGFDPTIGDDEWSERDYRNNVTILSGDIDKDSTLDADNSWHVVRGSGKARTVPLALIDGFTITMGFADGPSSPPGYHDCGAGMVNEGDTTVDNCIIRDNHAEFCAGGMLNYDSDSIITNCVFADNEAVTGAGMYNDGVDETTIRNCVFADNTATAHGGGLYLIVNGPSLTNCTFNGNDADKGGAVYTNHPCMASFVNCILWGNTATTSGGEIYVYASLGFPSAFGWCDIEGGLNGDKCGGDKNSYDGGGNRSGDPDFVDDTDPDGNDDKFMTTDDGLSIDSGSDVIDQGNNIAISEPNDIAGNTRKIDGDDNGSEIVDMGAYEYDPNIIYVDEDATGTDDGTTWANAFLKLRDALDAANSGGEIWVAEGTYYPDEGDGVTNNDQTESFQLIDGVAVYGGFDPTIGDDKWAERDYVNNITILSGDIEQDSTLDADNSWHVVTGAGDANTIIDGFTIKMGYADGPRLPDGHNCGGGMSNRNADTTVENCIFRDNYGQGGGGMLSHNSNSAITNCVFTDNEAEDGAGMYNANSPSSTATVTNCVFADNTANEDGGGIAVIGDSSTITNCTFNGNNADRGGAVYALYGVASFTNCILWGNTATTSGGEIYVDPQVPAVPTFSYCDIEGGLNGSKCGGDDSDDGGGNRSGDPDFVDDTDPDGSDGKFMTTDDGLSIDSSSDCIDKGNNSAISEPYDIAGNTRKIDGDENSSVIVDMGAYEYDPG